MNGLRKFEVKEVFNILENQLRKHLPKKINDTTLQYRIEFIEDLGFRTTIKVFDPEVSSLCGIFVIVFDSHEISFIPAEKREEFINVVWMHTINTFLIDLIEGINGNDLTELKNKIKESYQ